MSGDESATVTSALPRDFPRLREHILARRARLPKRLIQVADFAIARPQEIAFGRVADVAGLAGVQPSTLIRFAKALGYSGFSELQAVFLGHARERWPEYRERLEALGSDGTPGRATELLRGFVRAGAESLDRLGDTIDGQVLGRAVEVLARAETIYLLGTRRAFPVTAYLAYALRRLGVRCDPVEEAAGLGPEQVALVGTGDALLAVSFTPYAPLTLQLATAAHRAGIPVVAITDSPFSPLTQVASVWLEVVEADHAAFRSLAGTFALAATLAVAVAARRGGSPKME
jgi:DNA-binding MurR/RpiR family transcriptional regulator